MDSTWEVHCDNCRERKRETVKHMFCNYKYPFYEAIRTKRHDKVVSELYYLLKLKTENDKLGRLDVFQIWIAENPWGEPNDNALIFTEILEDVWIRSRRPDMIFGYQPPARQGDDEKMIYQNYKNEIWKVSIVMANAIANAKWQKMDKYNELVDALCRKYLQNDVRFCAMVLRVIGTVPASIEQTLH